MFYRWGYVSSFNGDESGNIQQPAKPNLIVSPESCSFHLSHDKDRPLMMVHDELVNKLVNGRYAGRMIAIVIWPPVMIKVVTGASW